MSINIADPTGTFFTKFNTTILEEPSCLRKFSSCALIDLVVFTAFAVVDRDEIRFNDMSGKIN